METKIKYTESGKHEIEKFLTEQNNLIVKFLIKDKYIMGDEVIEITGNDVIKLKQKLIINYRGNEAKKTSFLKMMAYLYTILGIGISIFGLTYEYFKKLLESNREQAFLIIMGIIIFILGLFLFGIINLKERRQNDLKHEKQIYDDITERKFFNGLE